MKIEQGPFLELSNLNPQYKQKALDGRFWHCRRVFLFTADKAYLAVTFTLFERIKAFFAKLVGKDYFNDLLQAKKVTILTQTEIKKIGPPAALVIAPKPPLTPPQAPSIPPVKQPAPASVAAAVLPTPVTTPPQATPIPAVKQPVLPPPVTTSPQPPIPPVKQPTPQLAPSVAPAQAIAQAPLTPVPIRYDLWNDSQRYQPDDDLRRMNLIAKSFGAQFEFNATGKKTPQGSNSQLTIAFILTPHRVCGMLADASRQYLGQVIYIAPNMSPDQIQDYRFDRVSAFPCKTNEFAPDWNNPNTVREAIRCTARLLPIDRIKAVQQIPSSTIPREIEVSCALVGDAAKYKNDARFVGKLNQLAALFGCKFKFNFDEKPTMGSHTQKPKHQLLIMHGKDVNNLPWWKYTASHFMFLDVNQPKDQFFQECAGAHRIRLSPFHANTDWSQVWEDRAEFEEALKVALSLIPDDELRKFVTQ